MGAGRSSCITMIPMQGINVVDFSNTVCVSMCTQVNVSAHLCRIPSQAFFFQDNLKTTYESENRSENKQCFLKETIDVGS